MKKGSIILAGINIHEGGPLTVYKDCLSQVVEAFSNKFEIIALVKSKELFNIDGVSYIEFPNSRRTYFHKFYYEYFYFKKISERLNPVCWLSLNDCTPDVKAQVRVVYFHNALPFYKRSLRDLLVLDFIFFQSIYYELLFGINIKRNNFIIVQQSLMMDQLSQKYEVDRKKIIVCRPILPVPPNQSCENNPDRNDKLSLFLYPAFPRSFKNFEVICEAAMILECEREERFKILLTISGTENRYARRLMRKYKEVKSIFFIGQQNKDELFKWYEIADCMIFPSKCEAFGLPIIEFKSYNKPMLLADLPYAHETLGKYDKVVFFNINSSAELAENILKFINKDIVFRKNQAIADTSLNIRGWEDLFNVILPIS